MYADFVGPLKTGKVTLRSDPVLPGGQNDILALILFGTTESSAAANPAADTSTVAGVAGGAAVQPINKALGGVEQGARQVRPRGRDHREDRHVDRQPEARGRGPDRAGHLACELGWVIGTPPPGTNPDTTLLTLNWRFLRKWSLETTVGDQGTSIIDFIWQHRY